MDLFVPNLTAKLKYPAGCSHFVTGYHISFIFEALVIDDERTAAIDVGAHVGIITRWLALNYPAVLAFEPDAANFACLRENVTAPHVFMYRNAVADREGQGYSRPSPKTTNSGGAETLWEPPGEAVPVTTIDRLAPSACSLIKIDVQGMAALAVLKGAEATLRRCRPIVWCEGKAGGDEERFLLDDLGGELALRTRDDMIVRLKNKTGGCGFRTVLGEG